MVDGEQEGRERVTGVQVQARGDRGNQGQGEHLGVREGRAREAREAECDMQGMRMAMTQGWWDGSGTGRGDRGDWRMTY